MTKLFFAADFSDKLAGLKIINQVAPYVDCIKIGLEAMTALDNKGVPIAYAFLEAARENGKAVMWDIKLHDIGNTMMKVAENLCAQKMEYFTLHASASWEALEAVSKTCEGTGTLPLAVTVLTDISDGYCRDMYGHLRNDTVKFMSHRSGKQGIRGFVCSPLEITVVRDTGRTKKSFIVTPGVRPNWAVANDQKNIATPAWAKVEGADAIVVGRPISNPPASMTPKDACLRIREELDSVSQSA
ncbi:MAG: pyrF [Candidatus Adlerbacteria bacterium]|nr:pyrF [Candidatus Adlerbacteria bacterium]